MAPFFVVPVSAGPRPAESLPNRQSFDGGSDRFVAEPPWTENGPIEAARDKMGIRQLLDAHVILETFRRLLATSGFRKSGDQHEAANGRAPGCLDRAFATAAIYGIGDLHANAHRHLSAIALAATVIFWL